MRAEEGTQMDRRDASSGEEELGRRRREEERLHGLRATEEETTTEACDDTKRKSQEELCREKKKGDKGLVKGDAKHHCKVLCDNIRGITKPVIRQLARRGGVKRISRLIYEETRDVLKIFLENVICLHKTRLPEDCNCDGRCLLVEAPRPHSLQLDVGGDS
ncbi:hypothetical protein KSP40_PGU021268 [Platanthera guangdongensis]|uniref:Histone H4 n=1 Tax=Platanthera guangdongensis TaxID=2320717 RepID=A0ABR2N4P1_9ASPA